MTELETVVPVDPVRQQKPQLPCSILTDPVHPAILQSVLRAERNESLRRSPETLEHRQEEKETFHRPTCPGSLKSGRSV